MSFREWVRARQADPGQLRKGERTRNRIRLAAVELLNEVGYRDMRVVDVCDRAGVTPPVLYLYFQNKLALTEDVLQEFLDTFMADSTAVAGGRTAYQSMYDANLRWIASARANAGLMRCLFQVAEEVPEFAELFAKANHRWYERIARSVIHRFPAAAADEPAIRLAAYAFGGMMDELTRRLFVSADPYLADLVGSVAPTDEALAQFLTGLWHRGLYGAPPPAGEESRQPLPHLAGGYRAATAARSAGRPSGPEARRVEPGDLE